MFIASAHRAGLGSAPGSSAWKIGSSGDGADEDAVAWDAPKDSPESCRQPAGPYARWRIRGDGARSAFRPDLPSALLTPRTGRRPQARPVSRRTVCEVTTVWLGGATVRAATRDSGQNGLGAVRSAVAVIRHWRTAYLVIDTIVHGRADHMSRRRHRQDARGRAVFPRRRTGAKSQPHRRRFAYGHR